MNNQLVFATLGPSGTCHELATEAYIEFQEVPNAKVELFDDLLKALELLHDGKVDFIIQNSAHPKVYELTEKYFREVFVIDSFLCPTRAMGVLSRRDVEHPRSLGLMPATQAYVNIERWDTLIYETAKPLVGQNLLVGKYDSGIAALRFAEENPNVLVVDEVIGSIQTAWLVYGRKQNRQQGVIGIKNPKLFQSEVSHA
ncbi:hypothetical protein OGM63_14885 [Plectonema radiosum NIES-515]|uniref:Prephenate dehydratase n=1 Tax=Plectonema radiosum NIES-515 TaxID=2986073 RepID=A0ABT3B097_9CYAN|nr:hypothetical protein [Plectonema radiosum]MCV3214787.1 hypothetical protein [Plectonema radiosum NIES-515]